MTEQLQNIKIGSIRILNPRYRDKKKFAVIVESIKSLGLKKPIKISRNEDPADSATPYDLICGQGRIEAFIMLGFDSIPAEVVTVSQEDRLLMSLVENIARRFPRPADIMGEIQRLKALGFSNVVVGQRLGITDTRVADYLALKARGEERLLDAALSGMISIGIASDIATADSVESQRTLLKAYQEKQLSQADIRKVKRLMEQRRFLGKTRKGSESMVNKSLSSAEGMVKAYRTETQRMRTLVRKGKICDEKIVFLSNAFAVLLKDENFVTLLSAEQSLEIPEFFLQRIKLSVKEPQ